jgi:hypothetical protein
MCVCVCVCVCVSMKTVSRHVCACVCLCLCVCTVCARCCSRFYTHTHTHTHTCKPTHTHTRTRTQVPKLHDWYTAVAAAGEVESELATLAADERRVGKPRSGMGDIIDGEENRKFSDWSEPEWSWQESAIWRARFREFATQWAVGGQCACCASAGGEDPSVAFVMHVSVLIIYSEYVCVGVGQERLGPSYFFISLVLGPLNSLVWYVPSLRYTPLRQTRSILQSPKRRQA